jgi:hypothetical protein
MTFEEFIGRYADAHGLTAADAAAEVASILDEVSWKGTAKYDGKIGHLTREDLRQQAWILCLELITRDKYDFGRPLKNFLMRNCTNRMANLRRDLGCYRHEQPCKCCNRLDPPAEPCPKYIRWRDNNAQRSALNVAAPMSPERQPSREDEQGEIVVAEYLGRCPVGVRDVIDLRMDGYDDDEIMSRLGLTREDLDDAVATARRVWSDWNPHDIPPTPPPANTFEFRGDDWTLAELAELSGLRKTCLQSRFKAGWSVHRAVTTPSQKY